MISANSRSWVSITETFRIEGAFVVPVPNILIDTSQLEAWLLQIKPAAILLSGGNDIGLCPARDLTERLLLDHAQKSMLPVLGICRDMQETMPGAGQDCE